MMLLKQETTRRETNKNCAKKNRKFDGDSETMVINTHCRLYRTTETSAMEIQGQLSRKICKLFK